MAKTDYAAYWFGLNVYRIMSPLILIGGTVCNTLAFLVLYKKAVKPPPTYFYLCSLAVVDTIALWIPCTGYWLYNVFEVDLIAATNCGWFYVVFFGTTNMAVYTIVVMTIDRFIFVFFPFTARRICTIKQAVINLTVTWFIVFFVNVHMGWGMVAETTIINGTNGSEPVVKQTCITPEGWDYWMNVAWAWLDLVIYSFLPFLILAVINVLIIYKTAKQAKMMRKATGKENEKDARKAAQQQKTTITLVVVSVMLLVLTIPNVTLTLYDTYWVKGTPYEQALHLALKSVAHHLMYLNNATNFLLYVLTGKKFRDELREFFGIQVKVQQDGASSSSTTE